MCKSSEKVSAKVPKSSACFFVRDLLCIGFEKTSVKVTEVLGRFSQGFSQVCAKPIQGLNRGVLKSFEKLTQVHIQGVHSLSWGLVRCSNVHGCSGFLLGSNTG